MNRVDFLLANPFHTLDFQTKLLIKNLGPHQPHVKIQQAHKTQSRNFNIDWYRRKPWLTASESRMSLYCFYCLLFGGEYPWTRDGVKDLKHLSERVKFHELTPNHIGNCLKIALFGKATFSNEEDPGHQISVRIHNEMVDKNRRIMNKIIDCLKFCGAHNLALNLSEKSGKENNRESFLNIFKDCHQSNLQELSQSETIRSYTSEKIVRELLTSIFCVYKEILREKVKEASFVSVQVDETTDMSSTEQVAIILRFVMGSELVEKFHGFVELPDRSHINEASCVLREIEEYELEDKLVAYTHANNRLYKPIKEVYPCSYFVHCYAHNLSFVMQKICSNIAQVRIFFANLHLFFNFFSQSSKRVQILNDTCEELGFPLAIVTIEDFHRKIVTSVNENIPLLLTCFEKISVDTGWDIDSIGQACILIKTLKDEDFIYFLRFFSEIMPVIDFLYNNLHADITSPPSVKAHLEFFYSSMSEIRETLSELPDDCAQPSDTKRMKIEGRKTCALQCCDLIIENVKARFERIENLACFASIDPLEFSRFKCGFPKEFSESIKFYPCLDEEKLKNELKVLYESENIKHVKTCTELYRLIRDNRLQIPFSETTRLLNISLTTPITTSQTERRFPTLKNIQNYFGNTKGGERSEGMAILSIESGFIKKISDFNERVIQKFAEQRNKFPDLIYK